MLKSNTSYEKAARHVKKKRYREFLKEMKSSTDVGRMDPFKLMEYMQFGFFEEEPKWKRDHDNQPTRIYVLCDDVFGSPMLRIGKGMEDFTNLCIAYRHQM